MSQFQKKVNSALLVEIYFALKNAKLIEIRENASEYETLNEFEEIAEKAAAVVAIETEIEKIRVRSAWEKGVKFYAEWIFAKVEDLHLTLDELLNITEKSLLQGAENWERASYGGCYEICDSEIAKNLCTPTELKRTKGGELPPNSQENWLDLQARALYQAARMVLNAIEACK